MAFRQPAFATTRSSQPQTAFEQRPETSTQPTVQSQVEESQEWVLFPSRRTESSVADTQSSFTERTAQTAEVSRASDLASFESVVRSGRLSEEALEEHELDSLDDNLHAFRESSLHRSSTTQLEPQVGSVLPAHDGLGTFPSSHIQDQIWQHEQFNPKRKFEGPHVRRPSISRRLDTIEELNSSAIDEDKLSRIEQWRLDQSRALLDEVERETRRRARKEALASNRTCSTTDVPADSLLGTTPTQHDIHGLRQPIAEPTEDEPLWTRLTRRFIRGVIGIDESLLSVIFGEALPEDLLEEVSATPLSSIPEGAIPQTCETLTTDSEWRERLIQRLARELGVLVNQISPHPGAFSTYTNPAVSLHPHVEAAAPAVDMHKSAVPGPQPRPASSGAPILSVQNTANTAFWGLEEEESGMHVQRPAVDIGSPVPNEGGYWDRDIDMKMILRFLRDRLSSSDNSQSAQQTGAISSQESARRAAVIRQHHPLVARAHQRSLMRSRREASLQLIRRSSSSCASQSIRSSKRGSLVRSGSSRNYWDIGGSIGSESAIASGGMMGAWGEV